MNHPEQNHMKMNKKNIETVSKIKHRIAVFSGKAALAKPR
jgi:hypothetical protein